MLSFRIPRYFDHSGARRRLVEAGFTETQAQGIVQALVEVTDPTVRTARVLEQRSSGLADLTSLKSGQNSQRHLVKIAVAGGFLVGSVPSLLACLALDT